MDEIFRALGLLLSGAFTVACAIFLYRLVVGNKSEYERNQRRAQNIWQTLKGAVPAAFDGTRDSRVSAGIAIDIKNNRWIEQSRLSNEAVSSALRRPQ
jgi:hypothetical protein